MFDYKTLPRLLVPVQRLQNLQKSRLPCTSLQRNALQGTAIEPADAITSPRGLKSAKKPVPARSPHSVMLFGVGKCPRVNAVLSQDRFHVLLFVVGLICEGKSLP